jgi:hypothetical protein
MRGKGIMDDPESGISHSSKGLAFKAVGVVLPGHGFILDGSALRAIYQRVFTGTALIFL